MEVSGQLHVQQKKPQYPLHRLGVHHSWVGRLEMIKSIATARNETLDHPLCTLVIILSITGQIFPEQSS
jgi:hypothetical protein